MNHQGYTQVGETQRAYVPLKDDKKRRLVDLYQHHGYSLHSVADAYKVHPERIVHFSKRMKKGLPLFEVGGRPPKLDEISVQSAVSHLLAHPTTDRYQIYALVREECKKTAIRRFPNVEVTKSMHKISRLSVVRWTMKIQLLSGVGPHQQTQGL
jgi:transposase